MCNTQQEDEVKPRLWRVATRPHAFPSEILIDQEDGGYGYRGEDPDISPEDRNVDPAGGSEQYLRDQPLREAFDLGVGQGALLRLQYNRNRERFFAFGQPCSLINVEQTDLR